MFLLRHKKKNAAADGVVVVECCCSRASLNHQQYDYWTTSSFSSSNDSKENLCLEGSVLLKQFCLPHPSNERLRIGKEEAYLIYIYIYISQNYATRDFV